MKSNFDYDWLDFISLQKAKRHSLLKEQLHRASETNPESAKAFGDFEYESNPSNDAVNVVNGQIPLATATLKCGINGKNMGQVKFHQKYITNLEKAYEEGSRESGYCPSAGGNTFNARKVRSPESSKLPIEQRKLSNHSFGTAIDFNVNQNPYKAGNTSEMESYPKFIEAFERNGFKWLGDGAGRQGKGHPGDDMHFEINYSGIDSQEPQMEPVLQPGETDKLPGYSISGELSKGAFKASGLSEGKDKSLKKIFSINDKTEQKIYKKYKKYFNSLLNHLKLELKLTKPVKINLIDDEENSKKVLGRTAGYVNETQQVHLFTSGRHIKDIMRSLAHELVHHRQNIRGEFNKQEKTKDGYAQEDPHLRKMEEEAYLKGNILFRDWEDNYKYRRDK